MNIFQLDFHFHFPFYKNSPLFNISYFLKEKKTFSLSKWIINNQIKSKNKIAKNIYILFKYPCF